MSRRKASGRGRPRERMRGSTRGLRVDPGRSRRTVCAPNPGPGPLKRGARARAVEIVYEVGGKRYRHKFSPRGRGRITLPASAVRDGWITD